jgi:hypothetical protein
MEYSQVEGTRFYFIQRFEPLFQIQMLYAPLEQFQILSLISIKYLTLTSLLQTLMYISLVS